MSVELADVLADVLAEPLGGKVTIDGLVRLSGGASRETWSFDAVVGGRRHELILQRALTDDLGNMAREARVVRAMARRGVPVPPVLAASDGRPDAVLGTYAITGRLGGETIARRILRDPDLAGARARLAGDLGRAAALVHQAPIDAALALDEPDPLGALREGLAAQAVASPAFELALRWLEANRPAASGRAVVHGDLRLGNVLVDRNGLVALLDWELVHVGDPMEDVGWLCVRAWRFGGEGHVAGVGSLADLAGGYESVTGRALDPSVVRWWEVHGNLKWGLICVRQAQRHLSGETRSVELAAIGRRTCEQEHELLRLLGLDVADESPAPTERRVGLHGRPTAAELVAATADLLGEQVQPALDGHLAFQVRVAANALRIVQRELEQGGADDDAHRARVASLGVADEAELAAQIRAGRWDGREADLAPAVAAAVRARLAVANPRWLAGP